MKSALSAAFAATVFVSVSIYQSPQAGADESSAAVRDFVQSASEQFPGWRKSCNRQALRNFIEACAKHSNLAKELRVRAMPDMASDIQQARDTLQKITSNLDASAPPTLNLCAPENADALGCLTGLHLNLTVLGARIRAKSRK
jgi:hypothetical protein